MKTSTHAGLSALDDAFESFQPAGGEAAGGADPAHQPQHAAPQAAQQRPFQGQHMQRLERSDLGEQMLERNYEQRQQRMEQHAKHGGQHHHAHAQAQHMMHAMHAQQQSQRDHAPMVPMVHEAEHVVKPSHAMPAAFTPIKSPSFPPAHEHGEALPITRIAKVRAETAAAAAAGSTDADVKATKPAAMDGVIASGNTSIYWIVLGVLVLCACMGGAAWFALRPRAPAAAKLLDAAGSASSSLAFSQAASDSIVMSELKGGASRVYNLL